MPLLCPTPFPWLLSTFISHLVSFCVRVPFLFSLPAPNCFEETPAGSVNDSPSCGDPLNMPCALLAVPWRWWSHTGSWLASHPLRAPPILCTHTHTNADTCFNTPLFTLTTLVSACQSVLQWLSLTTQLLLHLASMGPPALWWLLWSIWDLFQNSCWSRDFWNIAQFREVKSRKRKVVKFSAQILCIFEVLLLHQFRAFFTTSFNCSWKQTFYPLEFFQAAKNINKPDRNKIFWVREAPVNQKSPAGISHQTNSVTAEMCPGPPVEI